MKSIQGILAAIMASSAAASVYEPIALPSATADERELAEYERQPDSHSGEVSLLFSFLCVLLLMTLAATLLLLLPDYGYLVIGMNISNR
jgi:flagellar biosynthesis protein FliP